MSEKAVAIAAHEKQPAGAAFALYWQGHIHLDRGERDRAQQCAADAIAVSERVGYPLADALGKILRGRAESGSHVREGLAKIEQGLAQLAQGWSLIAAPTTLLWLGEGFRRAGRRDDALQTFERGIARAKETAQHGADAELCRLTAETLLDGDEASLGQAEALLRRALEIAQHQETKSFELRAATSLARLWEGQGKRAEAHGLLAPVYNWFTEGFDTADLQDAKVLLEELEE